MFAHMSIFGPPVFEILVNACSELFILKPKNSLMKGKSIKIKHFKIVENYLNLLIILDIYFNDGNFKGH